MSKRIWKKGKAEEISLKKSTNRMGRDLLRVSEAKHRQAFHGYMKNKSPEQKDKIIRNKMLDKAMENARNYLIGTTRELEHLEKQCETLLEGMKKISAQYAISKDVGFLKRFVNSAQTVVSSKKTIVKKLRTYEKTIPKKDAKIVKEKIKNTEESIKKITKKISKLKKVIVEMSG